MSVFASADSISYCVRGIIHSGLVAGHNLEHLDPQRDTRRRVYYHGFQHPHGGRNRGHGLNSSLIDAAVGALLADASKGRHWVAEQAGKIIGQIMVTCEWSDWRHGTMWWIQSVYVDSDHRRQGVFSMQYQHVESVARLDKTGRSLRLYVEKENRNAQATYAALSTSHAGYEVMQTDFSKSINEKE